MSSKAALSILRSGHRESGFFSVEFAIPMQWKLIPSSLFCHSILSGVGVDEIWDLIVVLDPKQTVESSDILTLGTSVKQ